MMDGNKQWELHSADDVAQAADWLRRRTKGNALVIVAIGTNSIAFAKDIKISPEDAADLIEQQMTTLRAGFHRIERERVTRGFERRDD